MTRSNFQNVPGAAAVLLSGDHLTSDEDYMENLGVELTTHDRASLLTVIFLV